MISFPACHTPAHVFLSRSSRHLHASPLPVQSDRNGSRFADDGRIRSSTNHLAGYLSLHDQGYRCWWRRRKHHQQNGSGERSLLFCHIMPLSLLLPPPLFATAAAFVAIQICWRFREFFLTHLSRYPQQHPKLPLSFQSHLQPSKATSKTPKVTPDPSKPLQTPQSHLRNPVATSKNPAPTSEPHKLIPPFPVHQSLPD